MSGSRVSLISLPHCATASSFNPSEQPGGRDYFKMWTLSPSLSPSLSLSLSLPLPPPPPPLPRPVPGSSQVMQYLRRLSLVTPFQKKKKEEEEEEEKTGPYTHRSHRLFLSHHPATVRSALASPAGSSGLLDVRDVPSFSHSGKKKSNESECFHRERINFLPFLINAEWALDDRVCVFGACLLGYLTPVWRVSGVRTTY